MNTAPARVQIEQLRPGEIRAALATCPVVYMPLGTYEYHQEHLPIGLDSLTAQGLCLSAARVHGGLVCPPLYYGTGGDHGEMPFTIMMPGRSEIEGLLKQSLARFEAFGVKLLVLFSGHFAPQQIEMIQGLAEAWNAREVASEGAAMRVLALAMNMGTGIPMKPDHAGLFETTLLAAYWPDRVDIAALPRIVPGEDIDAGRSPYGRQRLDPAHPLWSIFGADPRPYDPADREPLATAMRDWLVGQVEAALPATPSLSETSHGAPT
jgi:creatinine amidohydrolase